MGLLSPSCEKPVLALDGLLSLVFLPLVPMRCQGSASSKQLAAKHSCQPRTLYHGRVWMAKTSVNSSPHERKRPAYQPVCQATELAKDVRLALTPHCYVGKALPTEDRMPRSGSDTSTQCPLIPSDKTLDQISQRDREPTRPSPSLSETRSRSLQRARPSQTTSCWRLSAPSRIVPATGFRSALALLVGTPRPASPPTKGRRRYPRR